MVVDARLHGRRFSSRACKKARGTIEELHERGLLPTKFIRYGNAVHAVILSSRTMPGLRLLTASLYELRREVCGRSDLLYLCMTLTGNDRGSRGGREMMLKK